MTRMEKLERRYNKKLEEDTATINDCIIIEQNSLETTTLHDIVTSLFQHDNSLCYREIY